MEYELIKIRVLSFAYQFGTTVALLVVGYVSSPDFAALVQEHFGTIAASLVSLLIPELVKHLRNVRVLGEWRLGASDPSKAPTLI